MLEFPHQALWMTMLSGWLIEYWAMIWEQLRWNVRMLVPSYYSIMMLMSQLLEDPLSYKLTISQPLHLVQFL